PPARKAARSNVAAAFAVVLDFDFSVQPVHFGEARRDAGRRGRRNDGRRLRARRGQRVARVQRRVLLDLRGEEDPEVEARERHFERHRYSSTSTTASRRPTRKTMNSAGAAIATPTSQSTWPAAIVSDGLFVSSQRT